MRRSLLAALALGAFALSCTAFVASQLSGYQGPGPTSGECFALPPTACGTCIAQRCDNGPNGNPPASLQAVCGFTDSVLPSVVRSCATDPSIGFYGADNCQQIFLDGGSYASTNDTQGAAENNVRKCITENCFGQCRICTATVSPCSGDQLDLLEAGTCGVCLYNAMNKMNGPCQLGAIQGCTSIQSDLSSCAIPPGSCNTADCSELQSPPTSADPSIQQLLACLWTSCSGSCP